MNLILQIGSVIVSLTAMITGILKFISISKLTRFEKTILTDYKKTSTKFIEGFIIVFLFTVMTSSFYLGFSQNTSLETFIAFFIVILILSSITLWTIYQIFVLRRKNKICYYIQENECKLYIHKAISEQEFIVSYDKDYGNNSTNFKIIKRDFLYDKTIFKENI